jgi:hypothetical protein
MRAILAKKLLWFVLYSAAVSALPVLATSPAVKLVLPLLQAEASPPCANGQCAVCPLTPSVTPRVAPPLPATTATDCVSTGSCVDASTRWWCRGPVRRGIRAVACFISRPWRR